MSKHGLATTAPVCLWAALPLLVSAAAIAMAALGCGSTRASQLLPAASTSTASTASAVQASRDMTLTRDFLRILYVKPGTEVSIVGSPGSRRAFFTASAFFLPPFPLAQMAEFPGLADQPARDLVAMRCAPESQNVPSILATWPNVFAAIKSDLGNRGFTCPAPAGSADNQAYCAASQFTDTPGAVVPTGLANALNVAAAFFDPAFPERAAWLKTNYGIYPAFSGLGLAVKGTYYLGPDQPISVAQILQQSIVPEYLLPNLTLAEAGCRCIAVPPYPDRALDPMDPDFITQAGAYGSCTRVNRLVSTQP